MHRDFIGPLSNSRSCRPSRCDSPLSSSQWFPPRVLRQSNSTFGSAQAREPPPQGGCRFSHVGYPGAEKNRPRGLRRSVGHRVRGLRGSVGRGFHERTCSSRALGASFHRPCGRQEAFQATTAMSFWSSGSPLNMSSQIFLQRAIARASFFMFKLRHDQRHSLSTFSNPRRRNCLSPNTPLR